MSVSPARLDLRLATHDKERIARAAALRGMPVSSFVRDAVLREADAAIAADAVVTRPGPNRATSWRRSMHRCAPTHA